MIPHTLPTRTSPWFSLDGERKGASRRQDALRSLRSGGQVHGVCLQVAWLVYLRRQKTTPEAQLLHCDQLLFFKCKFHHIFLELSQLATPVHYSALYQFGRC